MKRPPQRFDLNLAKATVRDELLKMGVDVRDPGQAVGTTSGGERQCVAIARAVYFGTKVSILDESASALGVKAGIVLHHIAQTKAKGFAVIFITHNVHHTYSVADAFTILKRGRRYGTFRRIEVTREAVLERMAGGQELEDLEAEIQEFERGDATLAEHRAS